MKNQFSQKFPCSGGSPYQSVFPEVRNRNQTESGLVVAISGRVGGTVYLYLCLFFYLYLYLSLTLDLGSGGQWLVRWQGGAGPSFDTACEFTAS